MSSDLEYICNRCGFGSDELEEDKPAESWFAQMGYEMYCGDCVAEWEDGVWDLKDNPDKGSPTLNTDKITYTSMTPAEVNDQKLYTYGPLYFAQKKEHSLKILNEVADYFKVNGV